jgi:hypothetical protein
MIPALALIFTVALSADAAPLLDGMYPQMGEAIYLLDSCNESADLDAHSRVMRVLIDDAPDGDAALFEIATSFDLKQVDAAAATPDGRKLYMVSKYGGGRGNGRFGYLDLVTGEFRNPDGTLMGHYATDPSTTFVTLSDGTMVPQLVLGVFSDDGTYYVGSQATEQLYRLDLKTGIATPLGRIAAYYAGHELGFVDLLGADMAFSEDDRLFLWTNRAGRDGAPAGLYEVDLGPPLEGEYIGDGGLIGDGVFITGLAFRVNGFFEGDPPYGRLVGSTCCDHIAEFELSGEPGTTIETLFAMHDMCDCAGTPYDYTYGDMATGPLGYFPCVGTIGYWKNHAWEYVSGVAENVQVCDATIDEWIGKELLRKARGNNFSMLTAQLIAAKLNTGGGGDGLAIISDAEFFLCDETGGDFDMRFDDKVQKQTAERLKDALDAFNNGSAISDHCN